MNDLAEHLAQHVEKIRALLWAAFIGWVLFPSICDAIQYGRIELIIHDRRLRDINVSFGIREQAPPKK
jgi:hypothetical protein